jgi:hypothetical protein
MILDERTELADATPIATGTGRALHGDVIDVGTIDLASGLGDLHLVVQIDVAVTSAGAATVDFELASDAQAAIAVDGTATTHARSGPIGKAKLVAGFIAFAFNLRNLASPERFLGLITNPAVAALTAGKASAFLSLAPTNWEAHDSPSNDSI